MSPQINWSQELAGQQPTPPAGGSKIDWTKELSTPTPQAAPVGTLRARPDHPIRNWLEDAQEDVKKGTTLTFPGKVLHAMGAPGLDTGVSEGASQAMQAMTPLGLITGPLEAVHGGIEAGDPENNQGQQVRGANEMLGGVGKTVGGALPFVAPTHLGQMVPTLATYGPIQHGIEAGAKKAGMDPDSAELIGNMGALTAPIAKGMAGGIGEGVSKYSGPITKGAGLVEGIDQLRRGHPVNAAASVILGGAPHTEALVKGVGDLVSGVGKAPVLPHEVGTPETIEGEGNLDKPGFMPGSRNYMGMKPQPETPEGEVLPPEPKALPRGAIVPEPSEPVDEPGQLVDAQAISTRGQGGKFTRQYLTGADETGGKSVPSAAQGQAWQAPDLGPKGPPQIIRNGKMAVRSDLVERPKFDVETGTSGGPVNGSIEPTTNPEHQQFMDEWRNKNQPLINTQPLTNGSSSGNMNTDMPENPSRRSFLKKGIGAAAGVAVPKGGIVGKALATMSGGDPAENMANLGRKIGDTMYGAPEAYDQFIDDYDDNSVQGAASAIASMYENHIDNLVDMGVNDSGYTDSLNALKKAAPMIKQAFSMAGLDPTHVDAGIAEVEPEAMEAAEAEYQAKYGKPRTFNPKEETEATEAAEPAAVEAEEAGGNQLIKTAGVKAVKSILAPGESETGTVKEDPDQIPAEEKPKLSKKTKKEK